MVRKWKIGGAVTLLMLICLYYYYQLTYKDSPKSIQNPLVIFKPVTFERASWEDSELIRKDSFRVGFGEHGAAAILTNPEEIKKNEEYRNDLGTSVLISDKISVNRSIPDYRNKG